MRGTTMMIGMIMLGNELLAMIASFYHMEILQEAIIAHNHMNKLWTGGNDICCLLPIHLKRNS